MPKKFIPPYRIGDVVEYVGKSGTWGKQSIHIIAEVILLQGCIKYSTNRGAWFKHSDFKLLENSNKASIKQLIKNQLDEEDYE